MNLRNSKILVVAAHPDDDVLGCGGTIAKAISLKSKIKILFLGEGVSARFGIGNENKKKSLYARKKRNIECKNFLKILGVNDYIFEERFCTQFDTYPLLNIVKSIENQISIFKPNLLTHNPSEVNIDHRITHTQLKLRLDQRKLY